MNPDNSRTFLLWGKSTNYDKVNEIVMQVKTDKSNILDLIDQYDVELLGSSDEVEFHRDVADARKQVMSWSAKYDNRFHLHDNYVGDNRRKPSKYGYAVDSLLEQSARRMFANCIPLSTYVKIHDLTVELAKILADLEHKLSPLDMKGKNNSKWMTRFLISHKLDHIVKKNKARKISDQSQVISVVTVLKTPSLSRQLGRAPRAIFAAHKKPKIDKICPQNPGFAARKKQKIDKLYPQHPVTEMMDDDLEFFLTENAMEITQFCTVSTTTERM